MDIYEYIKYIAAMNNNNAPKRSFLKRAYDSAKEVVDETREDAGDLRSKHVQPVLEAGKNRVIGMSAGAKMGFVIGIKGGPKGMALGTAFGAAVGLLGGKPAVESLERGIDRIFGPAKKNEANDNKPENKPDDPSEKKPPSSPAP